MTRQQCCHNGVDAVGIDAACHAIAGVNMHLRSVVGVESWRSCVVRVGARLLVISKVRMRQVGRYWHGAPEGNAGIFGDARLLYDVAG